MRALLGVLVGLLARLWLATLRFEVLGPEAGELPPARPWVLCFFHGHQFALLGWRRRRRTAVLVSLSRDGDLQARALPRLGLTVRRGSSSRGGVRGLASLLRLLRQGGWDAAFAVDGPRGPFGAVHEGALLAARRSGGVLVPLSCASARPITLRRAWDRFELPLPFGRVVVALGEPLEVASSPLGEQGEALGRAIERCRQRAEARLGRSDLRSSPSGLAASRRATGPRAR